MPTERDALVEEIAAKIGDVLVSDVEDPVSEAWTLAEAVLATAERHFARRVAEAVAAERKACNEIAAKEAERAKGRLSQPQEHLGDIVLAVPGRRAVN